MYICLDGKDYEDYEVQSYTYLQVLVVNLPLCTTKYHFLPPDLKNGVDSIEI